MCTAWLAGCSKKVADPVTRSSFLLNTFVTVTLYDSEDHSGRLHDTLFRL